MGIERNPQPVAGERGPRVLRFSPFELDLRSGELRRSGVLVHLQPQPSKVLELLASRAGELVTREEIQRELWPAGTFVDFEQSLNFCIRQIRSALGDSALTPRYLETLPRRGYRWIGPAEWLGDDPASPRLQAPPAPSEPEAAPGPPGGRELDATQARSDGRWFLVAGAVVAALGLGAGAYLAPSGSVHAVPRFRRITFHRGYVESARFASDGNVVYSASWEGQPVAIYTAQVESRDSRRLDSPHGRVVGVSRAGEAAFLQGPILARLPLAGGPPKEVLAGVVQADWRPDGSDFAVVRSYVGVAHVEFPIGKVLCDAIAPTDIRVAPNGERVAFLDHPISWDDRGYVVVVDRQGTKTQLSGPWASIEGIAWSPRGDEIWFTAARVGADSALYAVDLAGHERPVAPAMGRLILRDVSQDGRVLIERATVREETRFGRGEDAPDQDLSWLDFTGVGDLSPDGRTMLFGESGEGGGPDYAVFVRSTNGSPPIRVGPGRPMGLSPDGRWVLSIPVRDTSHIDLLPTGAGEVRTIRDDAVTEFDVATWHPDGKRFFFTGMERGSAKSRTFVMNLDGGKPIPLTAPGMGLFRFTPSKDGRSLIASCEQGLCLYPLDGGPVKPVPSTEPGWVPMGVDGSGRIYVRASAKDGPRFLRFDAATGKSERWRELGPPDPAGVVAIADLVVSRDSFAFAYSYQRRLSDLLVAEDLR